MVIDVKLSLFYIFSAIIITSAFSVIFAKHPVRAVLSLVLAFVASTGIWLLANTEFLALILIIVYVGAVMVLFLFVVMMLDVDLSAMRAGYTKSFPAALVLSLGFFALLYYAISSSGFGVKNYPIPEAKPEDYSNIKELGLELFTNYLYSFELAGALLMVAIVAAIALAFRGPKVRKNQNISEQVKVRKEDRLKIIKM